MVVVTKATIMARIRKRIGYLERYGLGTSNDIVLNRLWNAYKQLQCENPAEPRSKKSLERK